MTERRSALFEYGNSAGVIFQLRLNPVQPAKNRNKLPVDIRAEIIESAVEIVEPPVHIVKPLILHLRCKKQGHHNRQGDLDKGGVEKSLKLHATEI